MLFDTKNYLKNNRNQTSKHPFKIWMDAETPDGLVK